MGEKLRDLEQCWLDSEAEDDLVAFVTELKRTNQPLSSELNG